MGTKRGWRGPHGDLQYPIRNGRCQSQNWHSIRPNKALAVVLKIGQIFDTPSSVAEHFVQFPKCTHYPTLRSLLLLRVTFNKYFFYC